MSSGTKAFKPNKKHTLSTKITEASKTQAVIDFISNAKKNWRFSQQTKNVTFRKSKLGLCDFKVCVSKNKIYARREEEKCCLHCRLKPSTAHLKYIQADILNRKQSLWKKKNWIFNYIFAFFCFSLLSFLSMFYWSIGHEVCESTIMRLYV